MPVSQRTNAEEEAWWARVFAERGMVDPLLAEFSTAEICGEIITPADPGKD